MSDDSVYRQLMHELTGIRTGDADTHARARRQLDADTARVSTAREDAETERGNLLESAELLRAPVPDLRAPVDPAADRPTDLSAELDAARAALTRAQSLRQKTLRAGQLPPLLPRAHHLMRNLVVYAAAMLACFIVQLVLAGMANAGALPADLGLWIAFIPPVLFLIAGWIATGIAGTPRIPMVDAKGERIAFTVYKSPRLGAFLAVVTIVLFFVRDLA